MLQYDKAEGCFFPQTSIQLDFFLQLDELPQAGH